MDPSDILISFRFFEEIRSACEEAEESVKKRKYAVHRRSAVPALCKEEKTIFRRVLRLAAAKLAKTPKPPYMTSVSCRDYMFHGNFHCFTEISGREGEGEDGASKKSTNYTVEISTV